jgi:branched-chain amino acid transport system substrate-binding protein
MKNKLYIAITVLVVIFISILVVGSNSRDNSSIKIGAILSLTGSTSSFYGENNRKVIELALEEIKARGGIDGRKVEVIYEDSQADKTKGISAAHKLIDQGVKFIICDVSAVSVAIAPVLEKAGVVLIATATSNPGLTNAGEYIFRTKYSSALEGIAAAKYIAEHLKPKTVSFLYQNSDYGVGVYEMFQKEIIKYGVNVVASEKYNKDETDFRAQIVNLKNKGSEVVIFAGFPKEIGLAIKQAKIAGVSGQFFAHSGSVGSDLYQSAGVYADGLINLTELDKTDDNRSYGEFRKRYLAKYNEEPDLISSLAYDAVSIYFLGFESCADNLNAECVKDKLSKIKDYPGVSGLTSFDVNGDVLDRGLTCIKKSVKASGSGLVVTDQTCVY